MKKVFVTGITGFLGSNVVLKLLKDDYYVIALVREKSNLFCQQKENLQIVEGDLFTNHSVYLKGVDYVIHIAAETRQDLLSYEAYRKINYDASIQLFRESISCNVKKILFISTANTLGFGDMCNLGNEVTPQKFPFINSLYARSKLDAENYLLKNQSNTEVIIINPTFMLGQYDRKPSSGKIIFWAWRKRLIFYPKGGKNFVHVEDVADGILQAIKKAKNGEKYLLANENLKYKSFFKKLNLITHQQPLMIPIPSFLLILLGFVGDFLSLLKIRTSLGSTNMKALRIDNFYSNEKSIKELGMTYKSTDHAIKDAIDFFQNN